MRNEPLPPIVSKLENLVQTDQLTLEQAQQIFLAGDVGFTGIPRPDSGFRLKHRLANPDFPEKLMMRILEQTNRIGLGQHLLFNGYACFLWLPVQNSDQEVMLQLEHPSEVEWSCWRWLDDQPPTLQWQRSENENHLIASLAIAPELSGQVIGRLLKIKASWVDMQNDWQSIELSCTSIANSTG